MKEKGLLPPYFKFAKRICTSNIGSTPGCYPHIISRSNLTKQMMFDRWVRMPYRRVGSQRYSARQLYWRLHPKEVFWVPALPVAFRKDL